MIESLDDLHDDIESGRVRAHRTRDYRIDEPQYRKNAFSRRPLPSGRAVANDAYVPTQIKTPPIFGDNDKLDREW